MNEGIHQDPFVFLTSDDDTLKRTPVSLRRTRCTTLPHKQISFAMRGDWSIENKLHWCLDVAMNEEDCRIRRGDAAELFSGIRHIAVNIFQQTKNSKPGCAERCDARRCIGSTSRQSLRAAGFRNISLHSLINQIMFYSIVTIAMY